MDGGLPFGDEDMSFIDAQARLYRGLECRLAHSRQPVHSMSANIRYAARLLGEAVETSTAPTTEF